MLYGSCAPASRNRNRITWPVGSPRCIGVDLRAKATRSGNAPRIFEYRFAHCNLRGTNLKRLFQEWACLLFSDISHVLQVWCLEVLRQGPTPFAGWPDSDCGQLTERLHLERRNSRETEDHVAR